MSEESDANNQSQRQPHQQANVNAGEHQLIDELSWLVGSWVRTRKDGSKAYEEWSQVSATELQGEAWRRDTNDKKVILERLKIFERTDRDRTVPGSRELVYSADVAHNAAPVEFVCAGRETGHWNFRNPAHDFPQLISYQPLPMASAAEQGTGLITGLLVRVSAMSPEDGERAISFRFERADLEQ